MVRVSKQNATVFLSLFNLECRPCGGLEDLPNAVLALGGAFQISEGIDLLGHSSAVLRLDGLLFHLGQLLDGVWVVAEVLLVTYQDNWHVGTEMFHFGSPFLRYVL